MKAVETSIIIPVYNEFVSIEKHVTDLVNLLSENTEVIVVDGGSDDGGLAFFDSTPIKIIHADKGRAAQMNAGASAASGQYLLFLHVDSQLPVTFETLLRKNTLPWGFFNVAIDCDRWAFRWIEKGINLRSKFCSVGTGDQGIFVQKNHFDAVGGYAQISLMEDIEITRRLLKHYGKPNIINAPISTSARRWLRCGVVKTVLTMWVMQLAFRLGVSPCRLARWYYR